MGMRGWKKTDDPRSATWRLWAILLMFAVVSGILLLLLVDQAGRSPTTGEAEGNSASRGGGGVSGERESGPNGTEDDAAQVESAFRTPLKGLGSIRIEVHWADDGGPAQDIPILLGRGNGELLVEPRTVGVTGKDGGLLVEGLAEGMVGVRPTCAYKEKWCDVLHGEVQRVLFEIERPTHVVGVVVGNDDVPVSGADVWLSEPLSTVDGEVVAQTDVGGRFKLSYPGDGRFVAARAPGIGASRPTAIVQGKARKVAIRLVLDRGVGVVDGRVMDEAGSAIAGARVVVGESRDRGQSAYWAVSVAGTDVWYLQPVPVRCVSDEQGRFAARGCRVGDGVGITIRADGYGEWWSTLGIAAGEAVHVVASLEAEAVLEGRVVQADGEPASGAVVAASYSESDGRGGSAVRTVCGPSGEYRIDALRAGSVELVARDLCGREAKRTVVVAAGTRLRWDAVLDAGLELRLRVTDADGRPLVGWRVLVEAMHSVGAKERGGRRSGLTDPEGRVVFARCQNGAYRVYVESDKAALPRGATRLEGLRPGDEEWKVVVRSSAEPEGYIRGIVVDESGSPVPVTASVRYRLRGGVYEGGSGSWRLPAREFEIGPLFPGEYNLLFRADGLAPVRVDGVVIGDGEERGLGKIWALPGGEVSLRVEGKDGGECSPGQAWLLSSDGRGVEGAKLDGSGRARFEEIVPGPYRLVAWAEGCSRTERVIQVNAGGKEEVVLLANSGVPCTFKVVWPSRKCGKVMLRWFDGDGDGGLFAQEELEGGSGDGQHTVLTRVLGVGSYRVDVVGFLVGGSASFVVGEQRAKEVEIAVREVSFDAWRRLRRRQ